MFLALEGGSHQTVSPTCNLTFKIELIDKVVTMLHLQMKARIYLGGCWYTRQVHL